LEPGYGLPMCPTEFTHFGDRLVRVVVADAQFLVRQGIVSLLRDTFPDWSFLHSGSLAQAMKHLEAENGDGGVGLVISDLDLPGMNGSAGIRILRQSYPGLRIALLTSTNDWNTIMNCLAAGVHGYLLKADASEQLVRAMQTLMSGGVYVPPRVSQPMPLAGEPSGLPVAAAVAGLTPRQQEVLTLLLDGRSTKNIAKSLHLGIGTVKVHLSGLYRTLAARNRAEAVARVRTAPGVSA
jgi:DNA-binding NarL/FixJ family response regulator